MPIKIINGNLFQSDARIIAHQVNCQKKMGSGVALQIKKKYPNVYNEYIKVCSEEMIGKIQVVPINSRWNGYDTGSIIIPQSEQFICNMFAQNNYGYDGKQYTNINALRKCMQSLRILTFLKNGHYGNKIAMPYKIGCCRGGANWDEVYKMIEEIFSNCDVELWRLGKERRD